MKHRLNKWNCLERQVPNGKWHHVSCPYTDEAKCGLWCALASIDTITHNRVVPYRMGSIKINLPAYVTCTGQYYELEPDEIDTEQVDQTPIADGTTCPE